MKRMCAIGMAVLLVWLGLCRISASAEETEIPAAAYVLMEAETGTVLLESNGDAPFSCGTMAKLMTALLTAEQLTSGSWTLETELTAGEEVSGISGAVIWLVPGEKMTVSDLLKGLIIGNAGDAAAMLAVGISGDAASFVMEMNARAFDLGMRSTRFDAPQGSNAETQYTTAADLARLCRALSEYDVLTPYFQTWRDFLRGEETELVNENTFARTDDTGIGFKACHTEADGWSIAAGAERKQMKCIAVVLGCQTDDSRFALAKSLLRRGFAGWQVVQPAFSAEFLYPVTVRGGICRSVLVEPKRLQGLVVPKSDQELETVLVLPRYVLAPVKKGQRLGRAAFYHGDTLLDETAVVASDSVRLRNFEDSLSQFVVKLLKL